MEKESDKHNEPNNCVPMSIHVNKYLFQNFRLEKYVKFVFHDSFINLLLLHFASFFIHNYFCVTSVTLADNIANETQTTLYTYHLYHIKNGFSMASYGQFLKTIKFVVITNKAKINFLQ